MLKEFDYLVRVRAEINSQLMQRSLPYYVLLPEGRSVDARFPVVYLLHGLFGCFENWTELTTISEQAKDLPLIMVMPEGGDGWYTDSATVAEERCESFLFQELIPAIDSQHPTIPSRQSRVIAGLSMGGYGAFKLSLKQPQLFVLAMSFSGAFDPAQRSDDMPGFDWETLRPSVSKAFGPSGSVVRKENDLFKLVGSLSPTDIDKLPFFYFNCGRDDGFIVTNRHLDQLMNEKGIAHEFEEIAGGHDWDYWGAQVSKLLTLTMDKVTLAV